MRDKDQIVGLLLKTEEFLESVRRSQSSFSGPWHFYGDSPMPVPSAEQAEQWLIQTKRDLIERRDLLRWILEEDDGP